MSSPFNCFFYKHTKDSRLTLSLNSSVKKQSSIFSVRCWSYNKTPHQMYVIRQPNKILTVIVIYIFSLLQSTGGQLLTLKPSPCCPPHPPVLFADPPRLGRVYSLVPRVDDCPRWDEGTLERALWARGRRQWIPLLPLLSQRPRGLRVSQKTKKNTRLYVLLRRGSPSHPSLPVACVGVSRFPHTMATLEILPFFYPPHHLGINDVFFFYYYYYHHHHLLLLRFFFFYLFLPDDFFGSARSKQSSSPSLSSSLQEGGRKQIRFGSCGSLQQKKSVSAESGSIRFGSHVFCNVNNNQ